MTYFFVVIVKTFHYNNYIAIQNKNNLSPIKLKSTILYDFIFHNNFNHFNESSFLLNKQYSETLSCFVIYNILVIKNNLIVN